MPFKISLPGDEKRQLKIKLLCLQYKLPKSNLSQVSNNYLHNLPIVVGGLLLGESLQEIVIVHWDIELYEW